MQPPFWATRARPPGTRHPESVRWEKAKADGERVRGLACRCQPVRRVDVVEGEGLPDLDIGEQTVARGNLHAA